MQNNSHIRHLKTFLGEQVPVRSIIVFSDRCTLKNVHINSNNIYVINRCNVTQTVSNIYNNLSNNLLSERMVTDIYYNLYPYTQTDTAVKMQHITNIRNN